MDVSKDMIVGFDSLHNLLQEICTARSSDRDKVSLVILPETHVSNPHGRTVSDQDLSVIRNILPCPPQLISTTSLKGRVTMEWSAGTSIELDSQDLSSLILKIGTVGEQRLDIRHRQVQILIISSLLHVFSALINGVLVKRYVMVTRNHDFMLEQE